jgi:hypothetical protein
MKRKRWLERLNEKILKVESGCWLWNGKTSAKDYPTIWFEGKMVKAHKLFWEYLYGKIPEGLEICHRCDVASCINPGHLFLGTHRDNMLDCNRKGRGNAKLSDNAVRTILAAYARGKVTQGRIAAYYRVSQMTISNLVRGVSYAQPEEK